jgi:hypothetical protein
MTSEQNSEADPRVAQALKELQTLITRRYPDAHFVVEHGEDPDGVYLVATVDVEETSTVMDLVSDRLLTLEVEEGLPLYVVPVHTPERTAAMQSLQHRPSRGERPSLEALLPPAR